jgi:hypothetical protein
MVNQKSFAKCVTITKYSRVILGEKKKEVLPFVVKHVVSALLFCGKK